MSIRSARGRGGEFELQHPPAAAPWLAVDGEPYSVIEQNGHASEGVLRDLSPDTLKQMYAEMVLVRAFDARAMALHRQGRIGFCVTANGEEAAILGSAWALDRDDWIFTAYRELGAALHRGVPLEEVLCRLLGNSGDLLKGRQMPDHYGSAAAPLPVSISSPIGTQIRQAVGAAWAAATAESGRRARLLRRRRDQHQRLPRRHELRRRVQGAGGVLLREQRLGDHAVRASRPPAATLAEKARGLRHAGVRVDGNDVLAVYRGDPRRGRRARGRAGPR